MTLFFILYGLLQGCFTIVKDDVVRQDTFHIKVDSVGHISGKHYYGDDTNGPLVIFSGTFNSDQSVYEKIANRLAKSGFQVITYDQRGHGLSTSRLVMNPDAAKPPVYDQATHDAIEKYHPVDLESVYTYAMDSLNIEPGNVILSLESGIQPWSFGMIGNHPELNKFILLTGYFGSKGAEYFNANDQSGVLAVLSGDHEKYAQWTDDFFNNGDMENVTMIHCANGWGYKVVEHCPEVEAKIEAWIKSL